MEDFTFELQVGFADLFDYRRNFDIDANSDAYNDPLYNNVHPVKGANN